MAKVWKEGDRVRIVKRAVTDEDQKANRYFNHMAGLSGRIENVYKDGVVAVRIDVEGLNAINADVQKVSVERMREKFFGQIGEDAKKALSPEELNFEAHFMQLVQLSDLEPIA